MTDTPNTSPVALLAPMPSELRPIVRRAQLARVSHDGASRYEGTIGSTPVVATRIGMGTELATASTRAILDSYHPEHVLVIGIAGGLRPDLRIGDVLVAEELVDHDTGITYRAHPFGNLALRGRIFTTNALLDDPDIRNQEVPDGIDALDMENTAVAAACEERGIPWTAIRVVSDHVDADLVDDEVFAMARPDGSPDLGAVLRYVARRPWRIPRLVRLGKDLARATGAAAGVAIEACRAHDAERRTDD